MVSWSMADLELALPTSEMNKARSRNWIGADYTVAQACVHWLAFLYSPHISLLLSYRLFVCSRWSADYLVVKWVGEWKSD